MTAGHAELTALRERLAAERATVVAALDKREIEDEFEEEEPAVRPVGEGQAVFRGSVLVSGWPVETGLGVDVVEAGFEVEGGVVVRDEAGA